MNSTTANNNNSGMHFIFQKVWGVALDCFWGGGGGFIFLNHLLHSVADPDTNPDATFKFFIQDFEFVFSCF